MSEPTHEPRDPTTADAISADGLAADATPQTYWTIVRRQFFRNPSAVAGLAIVALLFVIAIFAPFLANSRPYYLIRNGRIEFPLLSGLTREDLTILATVVCAAAAYIAGRRQARRGRLHPWHIPVATASIALALTTYVLFALVARSSEWTDYRALAASPDVRAVFPPIRYGPDETDLDSCRIPPGGAPGHPLGTDPLGRDVASRLIWASRVSLAVGFVAEGVAVLIGVALGAIAGYFGRRTDFLIMRGVEIMICFPAFFLILTVVATFGRHLWLIMLVIGLTEWTGNARLIRAEFLRLRSLEYTAAAQALGLPWPRIVARHLLPNAIAPVLVNASFGVASAILVEGGLSFLGFGVAPPQATWGVMLNDARTNPQALPWLIVLPGLAIFLAVLAYNLVGEGLRDALDPKLRSA